MGIKGDGAVEKRIGAAGIGAHRQRRSRPVGSAE